VWGKRILAMAWISRANARFAKRSHAIVEAVSAAFSGKEWRNCALPPPNQ
jgi:hypothetical protein